MDARLGILIEESFDTADAAWDRHEQKISGGYSALEKKHESGVKRMSGHWDQYRAGALSSIKTIEEYRQEWDTKSTRLLVGHIKELQDARVNENIAYRKGVAEGDSVSTRVHKNRLEQISLESQALKQLSIERTEVQRQGFGSIIGQLGFGRETTNLFQAFHSMLGDSPIGFGGPAMLSGGGGLAGMAAPFAEIIGALGVGELGKKFVEAGQDAARTTQNMRLAFESAGLSGGKLNEQLDRTTKLADSLVDRWNVTSERTKQVSTYVAQLGNVLGNDNERITKLAVGIEELTREFVGGGITAEQFAKILSRAPDAETYVGRLTLAFPALAEKMKEATNNADELRIAEEYLAPKLQELDARANSQAEASHKLATQWHEFKETIGGIIFPAVAFGIDGVTYALQGLLHVVKGAGDDFRKTHPPIADFTAQVDNADYRVRKLKEDIDAANPSLMLFKRLLAESKGGPSATQEEPLSDYLKKLTEKREKIEEIQNTVARHRTEHAGKLSADDLKLLQQAKQLERDLDVFNKQHLRTGIEIGSENDPNAASKQKSAFDRQEQLAASHYSNALNSLNDQAKSEIASGEKAKDALARLEEYKLQVELSYQHRRLEIATKFSKDTSEITRRISEIELKVDSEASLKKQEQKDKDAATALKKEEEAFQHHLERLNKQYEEERKLEEKRSKMREELQKQVEDRTDKAIDNKFKRETAKENRDYEREQRKILDQADGTHETRMVIERQLDELEKAHKQTIKNIASDADADRLKKLKEAWKGLGDELAQTNGNLEDMMKVLGTRALAAALEQLMDALAVGTQKTTAIPAFHDSPLLATTGAPRIGGKYLVLGDGDDRLVKGYEDGDVVGEDSIFAKLGMRHALPGMAGASDSTPKRDTVHRTADEERYNSDIIEQQQEEKKQNRDTALRRRYYDRLKKSGPHEIGLKEPEIDPIDLIGGGVAGATEGLIKGGIRTVLKSGFKGMAESHPLTHLFAEAAEGAGKKDVEEIASGYLKKRALLALLESKKEYYDGEYTGFGNPHEPAGVVHKDEFVFSSPAVRRIGVDRLRALHRTARGYEDGGLATSGLLQMFGGQSDPFGMLGGSEASGEESGGVSGFIKDFMKSKGKGMLSGGFDSLVGGASSSIIGLGKKSGDAATQGVGALMGGMDVAKDLMMGNPMGAASHAMQIMGSLMAEGDSRPVTHYSNPLVSNHSQQKQTTLLQDISGALKNYQPVMPVDSHFEGVRNRGLNEEGNASYGS